MAAGTAMPGTAMCVAASAASADAVSGAGSLERPSRIVRDACSCPASLWHLSGGLSRGAVDVWVPGGWRTRGSGEEMRHRPRW